MDVEKIGIDNNAGEASVSMNTNYYILLENKQIEELKRKCNKKDKHIRRLTHLIATRTESINRLECVIEKMLPKIYTHLIDVKEASWQESDTVKLQLELFEDLQ